MRPRHRTFALLAILTLAILAGRAAGAADPSHAFHPSQEVEAFLQDKAAHSIDLADLGLGATVRVQTEGRDGDAKGNTNDTHQLIDATAGGYLPFKHTSATVTLPGGRPTSVSAAGFYLRRSRPGATVRIAVEQADGTFQPVIEPYELTSGDAGMYLWSFDAQRTARVRVRVEMPGDHVANIREIYVFEQAHEDRAESVLSAGGVNLARREAGGVVFYPGPGGYRSLVSLIDGNPRKGASFRPGDETWASPVIAFAGNREAIVREITLRARETDSGPVVDELPAKVRVHVAREDPFEGYRSVGAFEVAQRGGEQRFTLPKPMPARFVKLELIPPEAERDNRNHWLRLGEAGVIEGSGEAGAGYESVIFRGREAMASQRASAQPSLSAHLPNDASPAPERESNDQPEQAQPLEPGQWVRATLATPTDVDHFRFTLDHDDAQRARLRLPMVPMLRAKVDLLDAAGQHIMSLNERGAAAGVIDTPLDVPAGTYTLRVAATPVYVLLGYDISGSMSRTFGTSREAIEQFAAALPPGFKVALANSHSDKNAGSNFTIVQPFTGDAERLTAATKPLFTGGGSSDWYTIVAGLLGYADKHVPPDAAGAMVYIADGNGSGKFPEMWQALRDTRLRLYSIGYGNVGAAVDGHTSWDGARGLFNVAWYTHGRYFEPHATDQLLDVYKQIFAELSANPEYAVRLQVTPRQPGTLVTEQLEHRRRPTLFVLDASGSMREQINGRTKLAMAKDVVRRTLELLGPDDPVGLRVYGHRYTQLDPGKAATDSELLVPIQPLNKSTFLEELEQVRARGGTPLAFSLSQAVEDLAGQDDPRLVLITDGVDSFRGQPAEPAAQLGGVVAPGQFAVVGFDIGHIRDQQALRAIAEAGNAAYFNARAGDRLFQAVRQAVRPRIPYRLRAEWTGEIVARGHFGDRHELQEGRYTCVIDLPAVSEAVSFSVAPEAVTNIRPPDLSPGAFSNLPAEVVPPDEPDAGSADETASPPSSDDEAQGSSGPRFCTQCGHELTRSVRWCPNCGHKLRQ